MNYPFTEVEFQAASAGWGCNCGPSALAFACQISLDGARAAIKGFDEKRYTSPTMMRSALQFLGRDIKNVNPPGKPKAGCKCDVEMMFSPLPALVRVQFTGPWTAPDARGWAIKAAYWHTHWIATWSEHGVPLVFDCNGGIMGIGSWEDEIVPLLATGQRRDGGWYPTHIWMLPARPSLADTDVEA